MTQTQSMFADDDLPPDAPEVLDRSTLERFATCPRQAWLITHRIVSDGSLDAVVGQEVHDVLSKAVKARHEDHASRQQLSDLIEFEAAKSRPDVQPAVIESLRKSYRIIWALCFHSQSDRPREPEEIIRYDGGAGEYSGQLAADLQVDGKPVRLTCELDLLLASDSPEEVELLDCKSGYKHWTGELVRESFQFQFYGYLVLRTFPTVQRVAVRVHMTREGMATSLIYINRDQMYVIGERIASAVRLYRLHARATSAAGVPAWPAPARCAICPGVLKCVDAHEPAAEVAKNPSEYLRQYLIRETALEAMKSHLTSARRQLGQDIIGDDGLCFGTEKPPERKAAKRCEFYVLD